MGLLDFLFGDSDEEAKGESLRSDTIDRWIDQRLARIIAEPFTAATAAGEDPHKGPYMPEYLLMKQLHYPIEQIKQENKEAVSDIVNPIIAEDEDPGTLAFMRIVYNMAQDPDMYLRERRNEDYSTVMDKISDRSRNPTGVVYNGQYYDLQDWIANKNKIQGTE